MNGCLEKKRSLSLIVSAAGFIVLATTTFTLFFFNLFEAFRHSYRLIFLAVNLLALAGLAYESFLEYRSEFSAGKTFKPERGDIANFLGVMLGTFATFYLSVGLGLGPVVAAGLVGIVASVFLPKRDVPIYCGAFVGMSCRTAFRCYPCLVIAGVIAGIVFVASKDVFNGFGGKLGTIAFFGAVCAIFLRSRMAAPIAMPDWHVGRLIIFYSVLAALATFITSIRWQQGPVFSSGLVGLAGGLILPRVYPGFGTLLGVIVICASFAGMSSPKRITSNLQMCAAGVLSGLFFIYTLAHFPGAGGKLGTIAFMSCIAVRGCIDLFGRRTAASRYGG